MFTDFLTSISLELQTLLITLITAFVGGSLAWLRKQFLAVKGKFSVDQQYLLDFLAQRAVLAVEQLYGTEFGKEKLAKAVGIVEAALKAYGFTIDVDVIIAAIEAKLYELKSEQVIVRG